MFREIFSAFRFIFLVFLFLSSLLWKGKEASAQIFDSIQSSLKTKPHIIGGLASKNTFIDGFRSPIFTLRGGLDFNQRINMGVGISWLKRPRYETERNNLPFYLDKIIVEPAGSSVIHPALQFRYFNLFLEYVYFKTGKWHFSLPIQIGVGDSRYKYRLNGEKIVENKHFLFLYEPAVSGQYKITNWLGVGLDVGYRLMLINNKNIGSRFNSPVYDIKTIIFWEEVYKSVFKTKQ